MKFDMFSGIFKDAFGVEYDFSITPQLRIRYSYDNFHTERKDCMFRIYFQWLFWTFYVEKTWIKN